MSTPISDTSTSAERRPTPTIVCRRWISGSNGFATSRMRTSHRAISVRLERSTRSLRLTDVGSEVLEYAQHSAELSETVDNIASNHMSNVSGVLRLAAPPSISDSLLAPLVGAFQASYPNVRVQVFITDRIVDQIAEGADLVFKVGEQLKDSSLVARRILTYRHQLV